MRGESPCVVDTGCRACVVVRGVWREVFSRV